MEFLQQAMDHIGGSLLNIGDKLETRNAWLIGAFVLFIPLALWGYSMFCASNETFFAVRVVAVAAISFGVSFLASKLLLTAIGVVFAILSGIVYMIGDYIFLQVLFFVLVLRAIMLSFGPGR